MILLGKAEMVTFRQIADRILLFLVCVYLLTTVYTDSFPTVVAVLASIACVCFAAAFAKRPVTGIICLGYLVFAFFAGKAAASFLPSLIYEFYAQFPKRLLFKKKAGVEPPDRGDIAWIVSAFILTGLSAAISCTKIGLDGAAGSAPKAVIGVLPFAAAALIAAYLAIGSRILADVKLRLTRREDEGRAVKLQMRLLEESSRQIQDAEVHAATLAERNRIAREIHDNVGHSLSRALLMTAAISTVNTDEKIKPNLEALKNTLSDTMDSVRASVHDLHDESIDLEMSIRLLMRDFTFCDVKLDYTASPDMSREYKYCMIAVVKEALSNIAKHSNATSAKVTVRSHREMHQLMIEDNGTVSVNSDGKGIGLENIENRVKELKGTAYFSDANGFKVLITLPSEAK